MDKRIVLTIVGVASVVVVIWLTTRAGEPGVVEQTPSSTAAASVIPDATVSVPAPSRSSPASAASGPDVPAAAPAATQFAVATPAPAATAESLPIDVTPGFEFLNTPLDEFKDTDMRSLLAKRHHKLQAEPRDPNWAERVETALRSRIEGELTAKGYDTQRVELPVVECRSTGCEIQALGYREDNRKPGVDLQMIVFKMMQDGFGGEFDRNFNMQVSSRPDERLTFFVLLSRN
jgi:hypothetical protein